MWLHGVLLALYWVPCLPDNSRACNVLIGIDENLYELKGRNMTDLVDLAQTHVNRVNSIYKQDVFVGEYEDMYFRLARVQVMFGSCASFRYENCTENREKFLEIFDQYDFTDFCLGYMFTYRDFDAGTAGLASKGTLCRPTKNSGFVTFLNYQQARDLNDTVVTLAHEFAHSLGSDHDQQYEDEDCGTNYLMTSFLNHTIQNRFSNCSVRSMHAKLDEVLDSDWNCLKEVDTEATLEVALCGNGIVEPGEECDCGYDQVSCNDPCCYPAVISGSDRYQNSTALPCSTNLRARCVNPPGLVYGVYIPLLFIILLSILTSILLARDWSKKKICFSHVTKGNIKIVNRRRKETVAGSRTEETADLSS